MARQAPVRSRRLAWLVCAAVVAVRGEAEGDATCPAGQDCRGGGSPTPYYHWPTSRGQLDSPGRSAYRGPKNLTKSLAWTWRHPLGQYAAILPAGPLIDDKKNVYLQTTEELFSFDSDGALRWEYQAEDRMSDTPSIWNGALYTTVATGLVMALDMETGQERWRSKVSQYIGGDIASVTAYDDRVYATGGANGYGGCTTVFCLNATTGSQLWNLTTDTGLWNFLPLFPGDGTVVFQTENGDGYVARIADGSVVWKKPRPGQGWTDGGAMISPHGVAYFVHAEGHLDKLSPTQPSDIMAYRLKDGEKLWEHRYSTPPNSWPLVAQLGEQKRWTVVFPYGGQATTSPVSKIWQKLPSATPGIVYLLINNFYLALGTYGKYVFEFLAWEKFLYPWPGGVTAFDPETGKVNWEWHPPEWWMPEVKGDDVGLVDRTTHYMKTGRMKGQLVCIPNPWTSPVVDPDGRLFLGFQDGNLYALEEKSGQAQVVDKMETSAGFSHPGVAMAPGMMVVANCDTLYVFKFDD